MTGRFGTTTLPSVGAAAKVAVLSNQSLVTFTTSMAPLVVTLFTHNLSVAFATALPVVTGGKAERSNFTRAWRLLSTCRRTSTPKLIVGSTELTNVSSVSV